MKNNLIEELSNDFKNKVDFRTLNFIYSDLKGAMFNLHQFS